MAPTEPVPKRQKPSPTEVSDSVTSPDSTPSAADQQQDVSGSHSNSKSNRSSWYSRTWPRKAAPIAEVARESISSASTTAAETASAIKDKVSSNVSTAARKSSLALTLGKSNPKKALPLTATTTTDHAMPESRKMSRRDTRDSFSLKSPTPSRSQTTESTKKPVVESNVQTQPVQSDPVAAPQGAPAPDTSKPTEDQPEIVAPRSWIGWLARSDNTSTESSSVKAVTEQEHGKQGEEQSNSDIQPPPDPRNDMGIVAASIKSDKDAVQPDIIAATQRRSWLPIWNNATASQSAPVVSSSTEQAKAEAVQPVDTKTTGSSKPSNPLQDPSGKSDNAYTEPNVPAQDLPPTTKPAAWVFWSREKPSETSSLKEIPREAEIAVSSTDTENNPKPASLNGDITQKKDLPIPKAPADKLISTDIKKVDKRASKDVPKADIKTTPKATKVQNKSATATAVAPAELETSRPASPAPAKKNYEHQLLPQFRATLKLPENPTLLQQLSRLFSSTKDTDLEHLYLIKDPPRIKNALAIGVHGYFPATVIRSVLGQPTGTSIKFADMAAKSIKRFTKGKGYECHVKTAALEGEGKIAERIDLLWKLLLNWIDEIRKADFVMVACHSQGVPVAIMLVAKLIHFGCISGARVGICAMAGVNMGPFIEFKSRWISGSAGELFEFSDPASKVSIDYLAALDDVLKFGVKLTYVGSIDDQLVSLESSIFAPVSHPHIYRAVSIDSRSHAPDFVSHLVAFALKLRNLGVQDHGLIRELSAPLAGSLYTGEGHSRLYEDAAIYDLAVAFALETSSMIGVPLSQRSISTPATNPFILPFAMRGILEEDFVKSDLQGEATELLQQFDDWKPSTKALKDVKFRLEGIRSRL